MSGPAGEPAGPVAATASLTEEPAPVDKPRRFRRSARQLPRPDSVTWLGESEVVKALEEAEARAGHRRRRRHPSAQAPLEGADTAASATADTAAAAVEVVTAPVPVVARVDATEATGAMADAGPAGAVAAAPSGRGRVSRRKKDLGGPSPWEAAGAAAVAAVPVEAPGTEETIVTDTATEEQAVAEELGAPPRRLGRLGSKQVAAAVALILAVEVGYIVHLNMSSASNTTHPPRALPALSVPPQSTLPSASLPVTTPTNPPAPVTKAASAPATTVPPRTSAAVVPATTPPPAPQPCTAGDLSFSTTTDRASYTTGEPVVVVTKVTDLSSCVFTPAAPSASSCPTTITVDHAGGGPAPMGAESCTPPAQTTMNPGSTETVTATLPPGELSPGSYTALGTWGWRTAQGVATTAAASGTFTIAT